MGSTRDSGYVNLHFEIRVNKDSTVNETINGYHYLVVTNPNANSDPELFIVQNRCTNENEKLDILIN